MNIFNMIAKIFKYKSTNVKAQSVDNPGMYLLNDPTTPQFSEPQILPLQPLNLQFTVKGYNPTELNSTLPAASQAVNCHITLCNSINYFQDTIGKIDKPVQSWAATNNLMVFPQAGQDFNAYYDRSALRFFFDVDPSTKKMVYAADSIDVIAHELGHGLLDIMRPDLWNTQSLEAFAFHEAFGDINAMVTMMQSDKIIEYVVNETGGELMKSNVLSKLAEELGNAIYHLSSKGRFYGYLRDASVVFKYVDPHKLPQQALDFQLCAEPHSFGRVFAGCWYEIFTKIFDIEKSKMGNIPAFKHARDIAYSYLIRAIKMAPNTVKFTESVAKSIVAVAKMKNSDYYKIINDVFVSRNIIRPAIKILSTTDWNTEVNSLAKNDHVVKKGDFIALRKVGKTKIFKISDHIIIDLANNPLYNVEMEVPTERSYLFEKGELIDESYSDDSEILQSAIACAVAIYYHHGLGPDKMWKIEDGKLVRNHIACRCHK